MGNDERRWLSALRDSHSRHARRHSVSGRRVEPACGEVRSGSSVELRQRLAITGGLWGNLVPEVTARGGPRSAVGQPRAGSDRTRGSAVTLGAQLG